MGLYICRRFQKRKRRLFSLQFLEIFLLSVGLAADAFAVSVCKGLSVVQMKPKHALICGVYFGSFQAFMPLIGYWIGKRTLEVTQHAVTCILIRQNSLVCGYTPINTKTFVRHLQIGSIFVDQCSILLPQHSLKSYLCITFKEACVKLSQNKLLYVKQKSLEVLSLRVIYVDRMVTWLIQAIENTYTASTLCSS